MTESLFTVYLEPPIFASIGYQQNLASLDLKVQGEAYASMALDLHSQGKIDEACQAAHNAIALDPLNDRYVEILRTVGTP